MVGGWEWMGGASIPVVRLFVGLRIFQCVTGIRVTHIIMKYASGFT